MRLQGESPVIYSFLKRKQNYDFIHKFHAKIAEPFEGELYFLMFHVTDHVKTMLMVRATWKTELTLPFPPAPSLTGASTIT